LNGKEDDEKVEPTKVHAFIRRQNNANTRLKALWKYETRKSPQTTQKKALTRESQRGG
jgi:hypothetical protein